MFINWKQVFYGHVLYQGVVACIDRTHICSLTVRNCEHLSIRVYEEHSFSLIVYGRKQVNTVG